MSRPPLSLLAGFALGLLLVSQPAQADSIVVAENLAIAGLPVSAPHGGAEAARDTLPSLVRAAGALRAQLHTALARHEAPRALTESAAHAPEQPKSFGTPALQEARATSDPWRGFRFWASGSGYAVGRRSAGYGVECGAALPIAGDIALTASYRLSGYASGVALDADLDSVDRRSGAAVLGLGIEF